MSRRLGIVALVAAMVAALAVAVVAARLAAYSWDQVAGYRTPYASPPLPPSSGAPPQTERLVLVIVDGLRADVSREMTALETLRQHGADLTLVTAQPSLSYPDWTTILSGAPQSISGVTTNGFRGRVPVETLVDTAIERGTRTVVVGSPGLERLYGGQRADGRYFREWKGRYLSSELVRKTLELVATVKPAFVLLHLPDVDEAGHTYGGASKEYLDTALKVDTDLSVLVNGMQDGHTTFVIVSDHGHIASGGHGGWEPEVVDVPAVLAGPGVGLGQGRGRLEDLAPTVAAIAGLPTPRDAFGRILPSVLVTVTPESLTAEHQQRSALLARYLGVVTGSERDARQLALLSDAEMDARARAAADDRATYERSRRTAPAGLIAVGALLALVVIGALSWRALVSALAGTVAYYAVYDGLFFGVHRLAWSLSSINSEDRMNAFFLSRLGEAAVAGVAAVVVAGALYPVFRAQPRGAWGRYLVPWLLLGPATVLAIQATLALQVAWYVRQWGLQVSWMIPDLKWGFKFDLDLMQAVALGAVALLAPVVTLLVGRYHPRVARPGDDPLSLTDNERIHPRVAEE